jgi:hypothetical protein
MSPGPIPPVSTPPKIHEAVLGSGGTGFVEYGDEIDFAVAVTRRQAGHDVVVRGDDINMNRRLAEAIETTVGPCQRADPHRLAGPRALPHYEPHPRSRRGHTFYETPRRKARRKR